MNRCPGSDAFLSAGYARCPDCGHVAYPVDAARLPDGTVLASYPAACEHLGACAWVVDPLRLALSETWCNEVGVTTGAPCRNRVGPGDAYCWLHDPARVRPGGGT